MTPEFVEAMSISLWREHVAHARIGDRIYLPISSVLNTEVALGRSGVLDAQLQAVADLVQTDFGSHAGKELAGRVYQPPPYLTKLYEQDESLVFGDDCTFIRAVAFGERPPPGYAPEPSPFDRSPE